MATATRTPSRTAALRCRACHTDAWADTRTQMSAASGASTGSGVLVTASATTHANDAASAALPMVATSLFVGGVHPVRSTNVRQALRNPARAIVRLDVSMAGRHQLVLAGLFVLDQVVAAELG